LKPEVEEIGGRAPPGRGEKLTFVIEGLGCDGCVAAIENSVCPMPGVTYVGVSLSGGTMTIRAGTGLDAAGVLEKVRSMGYGVQAGPGVDATLLRECPCRRNGRYSSAGNGPVPR
jgi:copper chaperone CopZ